MGKVTLVSGWSGGGCGTSVYANLHNLKCTAALIKNIVQELQ